MEKLIGKKVIVRGDRSGVFMTRTVMKNIEKYFESEDEE